MDSAAKRGLLRNLPKLAVGSVSALAALYLGLSPRLAPRLYSSRLFKPYRFPEGQWDTLEIAGVPREDVWFNAVDGSRLHGWYFDTPKAVKTILFSHGNTGNLSGRQNYLKLLIEAGAAVFIYDYRGYGKSEGGPTIRGICEDGVVAYDYLINERGVKPKDIVLYGESLGTAVACEIGAERDPCAIILQSGFSSLKRISEDTMPFTKLYPAALFPKPLLNAAERMSSRKNCYPLLLIHGHKDKVVPFAHAEEILARACEPKRLIPLPECAHSDIWCTSPELFVEAVREFLKELPC
jgi:fermentation-respiration switch protein FrsA (DUF1100 family)